jgi:hypothetical protein
MRLVIRVKTIPQTVAASIGRVVYKWTIQENMLRQIAYRLVGTDNKIGRVAIRTPRAKDFPAMYRDLLYIRKIKIKHNPNSLSAKLEGAEKLRDLVAHSAIVTASDMPGIFFQQIAGNWSNHPDVPNMNTRIVPQMLPVKQVLRDARNAIGRTLTITRKLDRRIRKAMRKASLKKQPSLAEVIRQSQARIASR